jgi:hypothetical protein
MLRRALAVVGFLVGGVGAALDRPAVVWVAIVLLSGSLVLRLIAGFRERGSASRSDTVSGSRDE